MLKYLRWRYFCIKRGFRRDQCRAAAEQQFKDVMGNLSHGDIAFDLGANYGNISRRIAQTGATVHAYEPDPLTFKKLRENLKEFDNIHFHNSACGDTDGKMTFYQQIDRFEGNHSLISEGASIYKQGRHIDASTEQTVPICDFTRIIKETDAEIALVKIDIEGAEVPLLEKLFDEGLHNRIKHIFVETHERGFPHLFDRYMALRKRIKKNQIKHINLDWV